MSKGAAELKAGLTALLALAGWWHLFGPSFQKWLKNRDRGRQMRPHSSRTKNDPSRNVPIEPL
jgi:hypothetical protein